MKILQKVISLSKISIMLPVTMTALTGYFLYCPVLSGKLLKVVTGVLLLAIAASVLNQIQERKLDALMNRTRQRPLANKSLSLANAWIIFSISILTGAFVLFAGGGCYALLTGLLTLAWYNGFYTYLKRITAFAIVPGALTGALPPLTGYLGAGGSWHKPEILTLCFVFFMAQIPHFWMIQMQYGKEYKLAGLPALVSLFSRTSLERLTFIWVLASLISTLLLILSGIITGKIPSCILLCLTALIFLLFLNKLLNWIPVNEKIYFNGFNLFYLFLMLLIIIGRLLHQ